MPEQGKWDAVINNDARYDGVFYYGVITTKVFCRPSCCSKKPLRENTVFFESPDEAAAAGFRPCKRCRPDLLEYTPAKALCEKAKQIIKENYKDTKTLKEALNMLGVSETHLLRLYYKEYHMKPFEYVHKLRINEAENMISYGSSVADAAFECGYGSLSSFYEHFADVTGTTPKRFAAR